MRVVILTLLIAAVFLSAIAAAKLIRSAPPQPNIVLEYEVDDDKDTDEDYEDDEDDEELEEWRSINTAEIICTKVEKATGQLAGVHMVKDDSVRLSNATIILPAPLKAEERLSLAVYQSMSDAAPKRISPLMVWDNGHFEGNTAEFSIASNQTLKKGDVIFVAYDLTEEKHENEEKTTSKDADKAPSAASHQWLVVHLGMDQIIE